MQVIGSAILETFSGGGKVIVYPPKEWGIQINKKYRTVVNRPDDLDELAVSYHSTARRSGSKAYFTLRAEDGYIAHELVRLTVIVDIPSGYEYANAARSEDQDRDTQVSE